MQIAIIQFPGSNCERETSLAVKRAGMTPVEFLWNEPTEKLATMDGYIIVGGFSYEDRSRAGVIAAFDPLMQAIKIQSEKGKPILGICNGAQILVESGLVPGLSHNQIGMALTDNRRVVANKILGTGYYNDWIHMRLTDEYQRNAFTRYLTPNNILSVPIAHAEGRFVIPPALLQEINMQGLNLFQYCDKSGSITSDFPVNPNGSINNIAAISNKAGNVMAMMPHPERTTVGDPIFLSMRDYIQNAHEKLPLSPLSYQPRIHHKLPVYKKEKHQVEWLIELKITDNHALTVQQALEQHDFPVKVRRFIHWEIEAQEAALLAIAESGVLYNERKESRMAEGFVLPSSFLVRAKEDLVGEEKTQLLKDCFFIQGINRIKHGIIWQFSAENIKIEPILQTNIIHNPYAHECYQYRI